ncbi:hypothetical protein DRP53_07925 [candidate division WOR-3 bacterium]|uniref:DUF502 domain-containing protein n=1 Tax=candidate division WOR-3 bacterium TaxID=2052148 RepID=A0A660SFQ8_UNCW3|nr:MAG: hypothetical protein DRP53_07925 [candidate division WOR-3 bacterium]
MSRYRRVLLTGLVVLLPIFLTIFLFWFVIDKLSHLFRSLFNAIPVVGQLPGVVLVLIGLLVLAILVFFVGLFVQSFVGRKLLEWTERLFNRLPIFRDIYNATRDLTQTLLIKKSSFRKVVLIQFPRRGIYTIGFVTNEGRVKGKEVFYIFVPTTPNPTSGWLCIVPKNEAIEVDITINEGLKLVISGGMSLPKLP